MNSEKVSKHIVNWLKSYAEKAGVKGFVVGVSGGIDSAVTSTLCAETGLQTICVEMPIYQEASQVSRALEHIERLKEKYSNVSSVKTDLTNVFEVFQEAMPTSNSGALKDLTLANTRARIRMTSLYYIAGINSSLVAGTGNKVEDFGVGFYTKYGDGGVDVSPIADLVKSEVFALGAYLGVPNAIQKAAPTDGLFGDSRTDEDQLGASYDELEVAMKQDESGVKEDGLSGREKEVFKIFKRLNNANKHKMNPIPVCEVSDAIKA
ncbi:NAD(+) synthase [Flavicella marina]|uniref:NAD(+) synthase n=1 Tax=Flavicella marina TaxID=1475951 RepID=UPI001264DD8B|nr:NAD(+) synthase [Flavicella marina]